MVSRAVLLDTEIRTSEAASRLCENVDVICMYKKDFGVLRSSLAIYAVDRDCHVHGFEESKT